MVLGTGGDVADDLGVTEKTFRFITPINRVTTIPEPASPISFAILGLGGLLLQFNKFREKKRI